MNVSVSDDEIARPEKNEHIQAKYPNGARAWSLTRIVDETETGIENDDESAHTVRREQIRAGP